MNKHFKELEYAVSNLNKINEIFRSDEGDGLITFNDLKSYPFDVVNDLGNGVSFYRSFHPEKPVYFITDMDPAKGILVDGKLTAVFGKQWHDCREIVSVINGHLIETLPLSQNNTITLTMLTELDIP